MAQYLDTTTSGKILTAETLENDLLIKSYSAPENRIEYSQAGQPFDAIAIVNSYSQYFWQQSFKEVSNLDKTLNSQARIVNYQPDQIAFFKEGNREYFDTSVFAYASYAKNESDPDAYIGKIANWRFTGSSTVNDDQSISYQISAQYVINIFDARAHSDDNEDSSDTIEKNYYHAIGSVNLTCNSTRPFDKNWEQGVVSTIINAQKQHMPLFDSTFANRFIKEIQKQEWFTKDSTPPIVQNNEKIYLDISTEEFLQVWHIAQPGLEAPVKLEQQGIPRAANLLIQSSSTFPDERLAAANFSEPTISSAYFATINPLLGASSV